MTNDCIPYYEDGSHISGIADQPITGKTFVKISSARLGGTFNPAATTAGDGGAPHIATADNGGRIFGVAGFDGLAVGSFVQVIRGSKMVVPVTCGATLAAFDEVVVGTGGKAVPAGTDVAATLVTGVVGNNNSILWTALDPGVTGNSITVALVNPGTNNATLSVSVAGNQVVVSLATGNTGSITSTAAQVIAAIAAYVAPVVGEGGAGDPDAILDTGMPVSAANNSTSTGAGVVVAVTATSLSGGTGGTVSGTPVGYVLTDCATGADAQVSLY